jgi:tRNA-splicing ligase RtcB (3'-phosphate/5'-hydroxy nucleic acid ligase)
VSSRRSPSPSPTVYEEIAGDGVPIKAWTRGVPVGDNALAQLRNTARLSIIHSHLAVMPDVHWGLGATIGSVIPTLGAVIPAAVGVDIGCGMGAVKTSLRAEDLPDDARSIRSAIEKAVPHGRTSGKAKRDRGSWGKVPPRVGNLWKEHLDAGFRRLVEFRPNLDKTNHIHHLGTLGSGNHFIEVCLDESDAVWFLLHSGSRGVGNRIATIYIELAKKDRGKQLGELPDKDLAYLEEGTRHFDEYLEGVSWAQEFARINRQLMMESVVRAVGRIPRLPRFRADLLTVDCHHNFVQRETHFGRDCYLTRKGAVRADKGELGIIPGSMGAKSYIVRGKGHPESFHSCSHGAGRIMSRGEARRRFSVEDHRKATRHVECRKDAQVLDETPMAYKNIDAVMRAQEDLVEIRHTLRQIVCVKG